MQSKEGNPPEQEHEKTDKVIRRVDGPRTVSGTESGVAKPSQPRGEAGNATAQVGEAWVLLLVEVVRVEGEENNQAEEEETNLAAG